MYRFLALLEDGSMGADRRAQLEAGLLRAGLSRAHACGPLRLHTAPGTPVIEVAGLGFVVGHLFARGSDRIERIASLPGHVCGATLHRHLLDACWGEYLLLQPECGAEPALRAMRDPSGGVACFHAVTPQAYVLTSDVSLFGRLDLLRARIDWRSIAHRLTYPCIQTSRTGLCDVRELLPGCTLRLDRSRAVVGQAWSPWDFVRPGQRHDDPAEAAAAVRDAVASVVEAWAEADRSLLLELSGGLDSSIVAASLRHARARVSCCTLVTPVPGADERLYARPVAERLGVPLQVETLRFDQARFSFELPCATPMPSLGGLQYVAAQVMTARGQAAGAASNFSGGGGDTVFCYLTSAAPAADSLRERGAAAAVASARDLATLHDCTFWRAGRLAIGKRWFGRRNAYCEPTRALLAPAWTIDRPDPHPWSEAPRDALPGDRERIAGLSGTQLFRDGAPRGTGRWMRMPLLSQPVVEACLRVPTWMWIAGGRNRAIARSAFEDALPPEVLHRRSKGTFMSYSGAYYERNKPAMLEFLRSGLLRQQGLIDIDALGRLVASDRPPRDRAFMRVLELCTAENWLRQQG